MDTYNNLQSFCYWRDNHVPHIRIQDLNALDLQEKPLFLIINVRLYKNTNLDTRNNLHFFLLWDYNHVLHIGVHDIDALGLQEKLLIPPFSL